MSSTDPAAAVEEAKRAQNQVLFRRTNEQIRATVDGSGVLLPTVPFLCECADAACRRLLDVPLGIYREVRASPRRFLHSLDHQNDGTSATVVATYDGFAVLEKTGVAAEVAEREP